MVPRGPARVLALSGGNSASQISSEEQPSGQNEVAIDRVSFENPSGQPTQRATLYAPQSRRVIGRQLNPSHNRPQPMRSHETLIQNPGQGPIWNDGGSVVGSGTEFGSVIDSHLEYEDYGDDSYGFDSYGCDSYGCDSYGCDGGHSCGPGGGSHNASLSMDPCRWFASVELLLLFRDGDLIPALVTTSPAGTAGAVAGRLPAATTLAGGQNEFQDLTAGGRLTIGTWLDSHRNRSLVLRGWAATESDFSFSDREGVNGNRILAVPTTVGGTSNASLVAFPNTAENFGRFGSVGLSGSSNVFGGDISVRQFWTGGLGTVYDVLYGYQFMRMQEDLHMQTSSTRTQDPFPDAIGTTLSTSDSFDARNEFHGGQFGLAGRYREGNWSFDWLGKVGFGQVSRRAERRGSSVISTNTPPANIDNTGLLVTEDNRGVFSSSTFGWVPEFDVSIGWHKYPRFDVTFGYNIIAMTDAVRLSGMMDPVNTIDAPNAGLRYDTFVMQGIHFGIRHVY